MRQVVQDLRSGGVEVIEAPDPVPGANEVLVRTTWSLISAGTERALTNTAAKSLIGKARDRPDQARKVVEKARREGVRSALAAVNARLDDLLTPGYSSAGIVEAVGPGVKDRLVGARVACIGANVACHAERVAVPAPMCIALPDEVEDRFGAFGALGAIAAHGVRITGVEAGSVVAVIGLGLVGQLAAQLATAAGARVVGLDVVPARVELARRLGAQAGVGDTDAAEGAIRALTEGHGADAVIIAAASEGSAPVEAAAVVARDRAVVTVVGDVGLTVPRRPFYEKELQLRVSRSYGPGRYDDAYEREGRDYPIGYVRWTELRLVRYFFEEVAAGRVQLGELITHEFSVDEAPKAYGALEDASRLAILLRYASEARVPARRVLGTVPPAKSTAARPRVALIGPGVFARATLLPLLRDAGVEIVAIAGRSPARAAGVARRWNAGFAASDADEVLADDSIDIVVIATRHDSHAELAARALEREKAVFLEKPLAIDGGGLARVEPLLRAGGRLVVDFNRSVAPATAVVRSHFANRTEPLSILYRVNAGRLEAAHWLRDVAIGGGRLVGEGCHFVDFCSAVVGAPLRRVAVAPLGASHATLEDDNFVLTLAYEDGSLGTVAYLACGHAQLAKERVELHASGRSVVVHDFRRVQLFPATRGRWRGLKASGKGHAALLSASLEFFRSGGEPPIPYERLLETTRATFAARDALQSGPQAGALFDPR
ncbi:MAG: bi-domain-containing oxidoreductase [Gaiellaceae bacterium]